MNRFQRCVFGYLFASCFLLGACVLQPISIQSGDTAPDDFIGFDKVPDKVADGSVVRVRYQCIKPCQLAVEVVLSTLRKTDLVVFRRKWICSTPREPQMQQVLLSLPPFVSHHQLYSHESMSETQNVTLRASLDYLQKAGDISSMSRIYEDQRVVQLSLWPRTAPAGCPSWSAQLVWLMSNSRILQCPHESDVIDMLKFPLASTGERFGVVRRFQPFISRTLERARLHAVTQPRVAFSVWIYLLKWCEKNCGIIHHVDKKHLFNSVLIKLSETGDIIIQARLTTGEDEAFRAHRMLPLWKWIRLDCYILDSKVMLNVTWDAKNQIFEYGFGNSIHYDDTDGYFVIGGSRYIPGIRGYFGPSKYYRLGTNEIKNQLHPVSTELELDRTHVECQEMRTFTKAFLQQVDESHLLSPTNEAVCSNNRLRHWGQFENRKITCTQTWTVETQQKYITLFHFLQGGGEIIQTENLDIKHLGGILFELTLPSIFLEEERQVRIPSKTMALFQASSCFGDHRASLLLAIVYLSGLGHAANQEKGHVYSLIGACSDDRFALMHAGFKHSHGLDGFPRDLDKAFSYYSNVGSQSSIDRLRIHEYKQYMPNFIYLDNEDDLNTLTDESSDVFQYLQYQAERGDLESQRHLGMMLYWGQNGVSKDIASAVMWFERSAMQMKDPEAVYDYSILLMKGQGVKRNYTQGFRLLKKAAAMGSINALNGLGWYHGIVLKDHRKAIKYFEQAALNGSDDGMFNLGIYHLTGGNPDKPRRNESAAFEQFLNASRFGHIAASVEAAWYLSTGSLEGVSQDVERAVTLLQKVCQQNGHLGFMMREALQAHLRGACEEAFVKYVLAAETGSGLAQSNVAHLCEELGLGHDCQWRYHNYSILNSHPHPSTLLKIGDYYYYSSGTRGNSLSSAEQAVSMYSRAALAGSPQGMFNLAVLAKDGHILPQSILDFFSALRHDGAESVAEKILKRCAEIEDDEAVTPCSLALLGLQMEKAWRSVTQSRVQLVLAYASLVSMFVFVVVQPLQSSLGQRKREAAVRRRAATASQSDRADDLGRAMGGSWLTVNNQERLSQAYDLAVTLSGVCISAFWTTLLYHLLR